MSHIVMTLDANDYLTCAIARKFKAQPYPVAIEHFADTEFRIVFGNGELFAGKNIIIIQSTNAPVIERICSIAFLAHELRNAGALSVIACIPYFGYARQEKSIIQTKAGPALVIAQLLQSTGIKALVSVELHAPVIPSFFSIPFHNVNLIDFIARHIKDNTIDVTSLCLVAPDARAHDYVCAIAKRLGVDVLLFTKERYAVNKTRIIGCSGNYKGNSTAIVIDDIIDTGNTALDIEQKLRTMGFNTIIGYFIHPVFSENAFERIESSGFTKVFVSNTIGIPEQYKSNKIVSFDISTLIVDTLQQI